MKLEQFPKDIKDWLNKRNIFDEVLIKNNINVVNRNIVIPIYSSSGEFLFNKYRRNPFSEEGPKYQYDQGATAVLYNANTSQNKQVFIVEGELDALCLQSVGYYAVSTTGGAGTFKPEWADLLKEKEIFICYDNDEAGRKGTLRLLTIFPNAKTIFIPKVKDVTEFFQTQGTEEWDALVRDAASWESPEDPIDASKKSLQKFKADCREICGRLVLLKRALRAEGKSEMFVDLMIAHLNDLYDAANNKLNYSRPTIRDGDAIERARAVPITEFIEIHKGGYAFCVAHDEKSPSMKYYKKNNHCRCYGCGFYGDTIDVVAKKFNISVGEAIKKINHNE